MKKLHKKVKEVHAYGCCFRFIDDDDGLILEVIPLVDGKIESGVDAKGTWRCKNVYDFWGNVVGCKTINCSSPKSCKDCEVFYQGHVHFSCMCVEKCPEEEED